MIEHRIYENGVLVASTQIEEPETETTVEDRIVALEAEVAALKGGV